MSRLRAQDGMTLPEVLIAVTVGFVVLAATMGLLESTLRLSGGVMAKTDAMQRGRLAMDRVTQELRSQVCLDLTTPAIVSAGNVTTADSVTFYSDFGKGELNVPPKKRTITFDTTTSQITETVVVGAGPAGGPYTYNGVPTQQVLFQGASRVMKKVGGVDTPVPFLQYFAFEETGNPPVLRTSQVLPPPLDGAEAARTARIEIAFNARPTGAKDATNATDVTDQVTVRHADPNLTVPDPMCV
jgi:hypothetical protein